MARTVLKEDIHYMQIALSHARRAADENEVPIGAIIVSPSGEVIGSGSNRTEQCHSQSYHAEVLAIESAGKHLTTWRLEGCTLYVTIQPCLMCFSLIGLSRISRLVFGAESPLFGYHLDKESLPSVYKEHIRGISSGIEADEAQQLMETFFKEKRMKGE